MTTSAHVESLAAVPRPDEPAGIGKATDGRTAPDRDSVGRADLVLALAGGPAIWADGSTKPGSLQRSVALGSLAGALSVVTTAALRVGDSIGPDLVRSAVLLVLVASMSGALVAPTIAWSFGWTVTSGAMTSNPRVTAFLRLVGSITLICAWGVALGSGMLLAAWTFGLLAGCEATIAIWTLGVTADPVRWWRRFLSSGLHLGTVTGVALALMLTGGQGIVVALELYLALHLVVAVSILVVKLLDQVRRCADDELREREERRAQEEHRRRGHWIHDDVCSELRLVRLRLETAAIGSDDVADELEQLDHRLRLRQLDEMLQAGSVRLAQIIQPYLRTAQAHGVHVVGAPRFEDASLVIDEATGRLVQRAVAVLVSNSMNAGATNVAVRAYLGTDRRSLTIEVEDDAGGFAETEATSGRGLDLLRADLHGRLDVRGTGHGTIARATIDRKHDP